jgi:hypothetical protein
MRQINLDEEFDTFRDKLRGMGGGALRECKVRLIAWLSDDQSDGSFKRCVSLLKVVQEVTSFETNRPFDNYWYGSPDEFDVEPPDTYDFPAEPKEQMDKLRKLLPDYREHTLQYIERSKKSP